MTTRATVRSWLADEGWCVIDSPNTPGGCWAHFSHLVMPGYRALKIGQVVEMEYEAADQDDYRYRAVRTWPEGAHPQPTRDVAPDGQASTAYRSSRSLTWDENPAT
ncbi:MAG: hypothetical protein ACRDRX_05825 [Pseudonocardiaceae bacterium]